MLTYTYGTILISPQNKHVRIQSDGTGGSDPLENYKNIGFLSYTDPDPLKITKLQIQHSMLGHHGPASETPFRWRADDGPLIVVKKTLAPSDKTVWIRARNKWQTDSEVEDFTYWHLDWAQDLQGADLPLIVVVHTSILAFKAWLWSIVTFHSTATFSNSVFRNSWVNAGNWNKNFI